MRFGEEAEAFIDNITKNDDLGKNRTHSGRRNSLDGLLGTMSKSKDKRNTSKER